VYGKVLTLPAFFSTMTEGIFIDEHVKPPPTTATTSAFNIVGSIDNDPNKFVPTAMHCPYNLADKLDKKPAM